MHPWTIRVFATILIQLIATTMFAQDPSFTLDEFPGGNIIGNVSDDGTYRLFANLGIEQWENGEKTDHRLQTWYLSCTSPDPFSTQSSRHDTWCSLERIVMDSGFVEDSRLISEHNHYSTDGTLTITDADWPNGRLDFTLTFTDNNTAEVLMRFKYWDSSIFLDRFEAVAVARGILSDSLSTVRFRVPEYDYILEIPVQMQGYRTRGEKVSDDFENSLNASDREIWTNVEISPFGVSDAALFDTIPNFDQVTGGERQITDAELTQFNDLLMGNINQGLEQSGMSQDGQEKARNFFLLVIQEIVDEMRNEYQ